MIVQPRYERVFMEPPYDGCVGMDGGGSKIAAPTGCGGSLGVRRLKRVGGWPMAIPTLSIVHSQAPTGVEDEDRPGGRSLRGCAGQRRAIDKVRRGVVRWEL